MAASVGAAPLRRRSVLRWLPWLGIVAVVVVALVIGSARHTTPQSLDQRTQSVAAQVRCPVCAGESVAQSDAPASVAIRGRIRSELAGGATPQEVLADVTRAYGSGILEKPSARGVGLLVWILPIVVVAVAAGGLGLGFSRWRRRPARPAEASEVDRVRQALAGPPDGEPTA